MLGEFRRGQIVDLPVVFVSNVTGALIDPVNPTVEISHYEGTTEIIDLAETPLVKIATRPVGFFTYEFTIPSTFILDETYYVRWRGKDPNSACTDPDVVENHFKVVNGSSTSISNCCCLTPRFNRC